MDCMYCGSDTSVVNSRPQRNSNNIWRRRHCAACGGIFTSIERAELATSLVVRSKQVLLPFSRDQLFLTVHESCKHRPHAIDDASALTQIILSQVVKTAKGGVVERDELVRTAGLALARFDKTAGTVYAAYHPIASN